jgi:hypothetical protein
MRSEAYVVSNSSPTTGYGNSINNTKLIRFFSDTIVQRKRTCIIFSIIAGILIITAIVVPIAIISTRETGKAGTTTMEMKTTEVTTSIQILPITKGQ